LVTDTKWWVTTYLRVSQNAVGRDSKPKTTAVNQTTSPPQNNNLAC